MTQHFLNLQGATTIGTEPFLEAQRAVEDLVAVGGMGAFVGDAGLGKTFAMDAARADCELESCAIVIPVRATMRTVAVTLLRALTGVEPTGERFRLAGDLIGVLSERPRLVVVDEAQNANHGCIEFLRHIHDERQTQFALALTGGHRCWEVLKQYPMLRSRIYRRVQFERMGLTTVLDVIPHFHRVYAEAASETIGRIDLEFAQGTFRRWTAFTVDAVRACEEAGTDTVDDRVVNDVIQRRFGRRAA